MSMFDKIKDAAQDVMGNIGEHVKDVMEDAKEGHLVDGLKREAMEIKDEVMERVQNGDTTEAPEEATEEESTEESQ